MVNPQLNKAGSMACSIAPATPMALDTVKPASGSIPGLTFSRDRAALISLVPGGTPLVEEVVGRWRRRGPRMDDIILSGAGEKLDLRCLAILQYLECEKEERASSVFKSMEARRMCRVWKRKPMCDVIRHSHICAAVPAMPTGQSRHQLYLYMML